MRVYFCDGNNKIDTMDSTDSNQHTLEEIYKEIKFLKEHGVKMKSIAEKTDVVPSVLSALYASVLPKFISLVDSHGYEEALDRALASVNNLSRRKLTEIVVKMKEPLNQMSNQINSMQATSIPFLSFMERATRLSAAKIGNLRGTYMSYSCSSSMKALKAEPYYFDVGTSQNCFLVGRKSVHNAIREGIGIIQEQQILYLLLNAFQEPNMSLLSVYLQLPFLEDISFLKGIYLVPDYNKNPIARRIVFVKLSDDFSKEDFEKMDARLIKRNEFTEQQETIYRYTCEDSDSIKMCAIPSPKLDLRDLDLEKAILKEGEAMSKTYE